MKLSNKHHLDIQFSLSSMTDIVFLLLIFFILTISSVSPRALTVDLPISNNAALVSSQVNITITAELDYYVDGQRAAQGELATFLQRKLSKGQHSVLLLMDKSVPVEHMVYVTNLATAFNAKVSVATKPE